MIHFVLFLCEKHFVFFFLIFLLSHLIHLRFLMDFKNVCTSPTRFCTSFRNFRHELILDRVGVLAHDFLHGEITSTEVDGNS